MASIDKIYMSNEQAKEYWVWMMEHDEDCKLLTGSSLVPSFRKLNDYQYVTNYGESVDWYLWNYCFLGFIQNRLVVQYGTTEPQNEYLNMIEFLLDVVDGDSEKFNEILNFGKNYNFEASMTRYILYSEEEEDE